jgi:hypothetical protein
LYILIDPRFQIGNPLSLSSPIPASIDSYSLFSPSFILDVPAGNRIDKNTEDRVEVIETAFKLYMKQLEAKYGAKKEVAA